MTAPSVCPRSASIRAALLTPAASLLLAALATAQCEVDGVFAPDASSLDKFGTSVAVTGDRAIVGARLADTSALDGGAAYVYERSPSGWVLRAQLAASDPDEADMFGWAVDIDGDLAVVGAPRNDDAGENSGAAYVFQRSGAQWLEVAKLRGSVENAAAKFGKSVSIDGLRVLVGAPGNNEVGASCGAAYVFEPSGSTWSETARLLASDGAPDDSLGQSVSLEGDVAIAGAPRNTDAGDNTGSAYVFELDGTAWTETGKLVASDAAALASFGAAVAVGDDRLLVGAPFAPDGPDFAGAAYVFERSGTTWIETATLTAASSTHLEEFGGSVALDGAVAVVGAPAQTIAGGAPGTAYLFDDSGGGWTPTAELTPDVSTAADLFGWSVSASLGNVFVGTPHTIDSGSPPGAVQVFRSSGPDCDANSIPDCQDIAATPSLDANGNGVLDSCECSVSSYCTAAPNSAGSGARIGFEGTVSLSLADLRLVADGLPENQFGIFFYGESPITFALGDGTLCIEQPIFRLPPTATGTGSAAFDLDYTDPPEQDGLITSGSTWRFQFWYRDPAAGGSGFNLSDALLVTFCP